MTDLRKNVIVIGAGIGGLATAIRLSLKGYRVKVLETASQPGGKLAEIRSAGFRFDAGPSLFTMPHYVDELFSLAGKDPQDFFSYRRLDKVCKYFFDDGTRIDASAKIHEFAAEIALKTADSAESIINFFRDSEKIYQITNPVFLQRSLHVLKNYFTTETLGSLLKFPQIDPFRTMNEANTARFKDPKTIQLFNRYATYNGSDPFQAPATLNVIPHFEQHFGAYFPEGGMYSIVRALADLAVECGVTFVFDTYADEILTGEGRVTGVRAKGEIHPADLIVSNMDIWYTYRKLLPTHFAPERILQQQRSSSALIFYWGINREFPELDLHNIFFTKDYKQEFGHIWGDKNIGDDPTIYLNISSKLQRSDAPEGCENWFTMINVPANTGQDWDELIASARANIIAKLSKTLQTDIGRCILSEEILDPRKIDSQTFSYQGALYGSSSNNKFAAFLRHANFSSKLKGLYFAGGSVHPGGGIPLALLSAKIVAGLIK